MKTRHSDLYAAVLAVCVAFSVIVAVATKTGAESEIVIQSQAEQGGVRVSWNTGNSASVVDVTLCTTVPGVPGLPFGLNCFWHETRYEPQFKALDSTLLSPNVSSYPYDAFPLLYTRDGILHRGQTIHVARAGSSVAGITNFPLLQTFTVAASATSANAAIGTRWNSGSGTRYRQISTCRTGSTTSGQPYQVVCSGTASPGGLPGSGWNVQGVGRSDPHWAFSTGWTNDGFVATDPVFVDPAYLSQRDTTLVMRGEVVDQKNVYQAGEVIQYNLFVANTGEYYPKATLALLLTSYDTRGLELVSITTPFGSTELQKGVDEVRPLWDTYLDPRTIAPGQEQLVLSAAFRVVRSYYPLVSLGTFSPLGGLEGRFHLQAEVAD